MPGARPPLPFSESRFSSPASTNSLVTGSLHCCATPASLASVLNGVRRVHEVLRGREKAGWRYACEGMRRLGKGLRKGIWHTKRMASHPPVPPKPLLSCSICSLYLYCTITLRESRALLRAMSIQLFHRSLGMEHAMPGQHCGVQPALPPCLCCVPFVLACVPAAWPHEANLLEGLVLAAAGWLPLQWMACRRFTYQHDRQTGHVSPTGRLDVSAQQAGWLPCCLATALWQSCGSSRVLGWIPAGQH